jgi:hypothetical protein
MENIEVTRKDEKLYSRPANRDILADLMNRTAQRGRDLGAVKANILCGWHKRKDRKLHATVGFTFPNGILWTGHVYKDGVYDDENNKKVQRLKSRLNSDLVARTRTAGPSRGGLY